MKKAFVLMTAMPPTTAHLQLIQFANQLVDGQTIVIVNTQPSEPLAFERVESLRAAIKHLRLTKTTIKHMHKTIKQDPQTPGFWDMWREIMEGYGITPDDYIVASETYGRKLAEITGCQFFPYDIDRQLNSVKATRVREDVFRHFDDILPEFRRHLRTTVTIFGAESTGKTTLSRQLTHDMEGQWVFEYARPFLEQTSNVINPRSMTAIWKGQSALQQQADNLRACPIVVQDTDLFSTVGYWQLPHREKDLGRCPLGLVNDARSLMSDIYIVTKSNIPFEQDPLRYGGDTREGSDEYWINICKQYKLPYEVLEASDPDVRRRQAAAIIQRVANKKVARISYDRHGL